MKVPTLPPKTQELIVRLCASAYCTEVKKDKAERAIVSLYEFHGLKIPKIEWVIDITNEKFLRASRASLASSASRVSWASLASRASRVSRASRASRASLAFWAFWVSRASLDYDFDYFVFSHEWLQANRGNEYDKKFQQAMELHLKIKESGAGYMAENKKTGILYVCPNPILRFNDRNEFSSPHLPAIEWPGGMKCYFLNGVNFPFELWKKVVSRETEMKDVLAIKDIDQRVQAMKFAKNGLRDFYKSQNGKCIDSYDKFDIKGRPIHYELWKIPAGETFNKTVHFAIYDCPSAKERGEQREYTKGVPAFEKVSEAMAWGMSDEKSIITPEMWERLVPLQEES